MGDFRFFSGLGYGFFTPLSGTYVEASIGLFDEAPGSGDAYQRPHARALHKRACRIALYGGTPFSASVDSEDAGPPQEFHSLYALAARMEPAGRHAVFHS